METRALSLTADRPRPRPRSRRATARGVLSGLAMSLAACAGARADVFANVPEAAGYQLVYTLNVPNSASFDAGGASYSTDNSASVSGPFDRIAYYMELQAPAGSLQYAYASMDAFTNDPAKIGIPTSSSGAFFQQNVRNMNVFSNVSGVVPGTSLSGGNIEFWSSDYGAGNSSHVPNATDQLFDSGDQPINGVNGYGSFQIHNHSIPGPVAGTTSSQTILAYNGWGKGPAHSDIGLGSQQGGTQGSDWTFTNNAAAYSLKNIQVLIHRSAANPLPAPVSIMPLGDSITDGYNIAGGYRTRLANDLASAYRPATFIGSATDTNSTALTDAGQNHHEGHPGYRIDQVQGDLDGLVSGTPDTATYQNNGGYWIAGGNGTGRAPAFPDIILVHLGTNDATQGATAPVMEDRLRTLLARLATDRPQAQVFVASLIPRNDDIELVQEQYNAAIPSILAPFGPNFHFVDMHAALLPTDLADGIHPNQGGYDKMGDAWFNAIESAPTPEPSGVVLAVIGAGALLGRRPSRRPDQTAAGPSAPAPTRQRTKKGTPLKIIKEIV